MSAKRRIMSNGVAIALAVGVSLISQVGLVPVFLSHWNVATYGAWLAIQGGVMVAVVTEQSFLDYVGFECMSRPMADQDFRSRALSCGLAVSLITGTVLLVTMFLVSPYCITFMFPALTSRLLQESQLALLVLIAGWPIFQATSGLVSRVLASAGEPPRVAWLTLIITVVTPCAQLAGLLLGQGLVGTAVIQVICITCVTWPITIHMLRRLAKAGVRLVRPNLRLGFAMYRRSWALSTAAFLEVLQQSGFRVVLAPLIGTIGVAQFSTLRTVVNAAQQGINTSVYPMVPEVMRYSAEGDKERVTAIMSGMWLAAVVLIGPAVIALQYVAPSLYIAWTHNRLPWDGVTFALLSVSIVLNGANQPGRSLVRGNNLLRAQLYASFWAGVAMLFVTWITIGRIGLPGAALGLVGAEAARLYFNSRSAYMWLKSRHLIPSLKLVFSVAAVTGTTAIAVLGIAAFPAVSTLTLTVYSALWCLQTRYFYIALPSPLRWAIRDQISQLRLRITNMPPSHGVTKSDRRNS